MRSTKGAGKQLPLLLFHDNRKWPVGHAERWAHDGGGLAGVWRLNDTQDAQTAAQLAEAGDLRGMSIGFQPIQSQWDPKSQQDWNPDLGPDHKDRVDPARVAAARGVADADAGVRLTPQVGLVRTAYTRDGRAEIDAWVEIRDRLTASALASG